MTDPALKEHQRKALNKLTNGKVLWGGVGTGKSHVAATYYKEREAPRDVYVITTAKKRDKFDWQELFYSFGIGPRSGPSGPDVGPRRGRGKNGSTNQSAGSGDRRPTRSGVYLDESSKGVGGIAGTAVSTGEGDGGEAGPYPLGDAVHDGRGATRSDPVDLGESGIGGGVAEVLADSIDTRGGTYPYVLTVDSWNNIAKYADVAGAFFIFDEQRLVGSGDWSRKFLRIAKRNRWILLSGTPGDTWMDFVPLFVANNFYKNRTEFKREHVVYNTFTKFPKVDRYINVGRLVRQRSSILVEMPYVRHTRRRHVEVPLQYDKEALDLVLKKRWNVFEDRPLRDVAEMFSVGRKVVNGDPSRLEMVKELWQNHPKLIVFYNFNYELEALRSLSGYSLVSSGVTGTKTKMDGSGNGDTTSTSTSIVGSKPIAKSSAIAISVENAKTSKGSRGIFDTTRGAMGFTEASADSDHTERLREGKTSIGVAEWNGHKHQEIPNTDRWLYLVQYTAGAEAWECIETDAMIFYSRTYSWRTWEQAQGRTDRLNTLFDDLWYYNFTSDSFIDKAIERSLRAKETFNEAKYAAMFRG